MDGVKYTFTGLTQLIKKLNKFIKLERGWYILVFDNIQLFFHNVGVSDIVNHDS